MVVVKRTYSSKSSLVTLTVWFGTECVDRSCGSSNEDILQQVITCNIDSLVGTECVDRSCGSSNEDLLQHVITRNIDSLVGTECVDRSCGSSNEDLLLQVITCKL